MSVFMDLDILMLYVTNEQTSSIRTLFRERGWKLRPYEPVWSKKEVTKKILNASSVPVNGFSTLLEQEESFFDESVVEISSDSNDAEDLNNGNSCLTLIADCKNDDEATASKESDVEDISQEGFESAIQEKLPQAHGDTAGRYDSQRSVSKRKKSESDANNHANERLNSAILVETDQAGGATIYEVQDNSIPHLYKEMVKEETDDRYDSGDNNDFIANKGMGSAPLNTYADAQGKTVPEEMTSLWSQPLTQKGSEGTNSPFLQNSKKEPYFGVLSVRPISVETEVSVSQEFCQIEGLNRTQRLTKFETDIGSETLEGSSAAFLEVGANTAQQLGQNKLEAEKDAYGRSPAAVTQLSAQSKAESNLPPRDNNLQQRSCPGDSLETGIETISADFEQKNIERHPSFTKMSDFNSNSADASESIELNAQGNHNVHRCIPKTLKKRIPKTRKKRLGGTYHHCYCGKEFMSQCNLKRHKRDYHRTSSCNK